MDETASSHRPNCLAEYREGFDTCADRGIALVPGPAPVTEEHAPEPTKGHRHPSQDRDERPVLLCRLPRLQAQLLVGKLQAEGLVASGDEPALGFVYGDALPDARMIRVWVLESQAEKAQKIARRALSGDDAI